MTVERTARANGYRLLKSRDSETVQHKRQVENLAPNLKKLKRKVLFFWTMFLHLPPYLTIPGPQDRSDCF